MKAGELAHLMVAHLVGSTAELKAELKAGSTDECWVDWKADLWVGLMAVQTVASRVVS